MESNHTKEMLELNVGDRVMFRREGKLYEGTIKSVQGEKIEIDDSTIELIIVAKSVGTIADKPTFTEKKAKKRIREILDKRTEVSRIL